MLISNLESFTQVISKRSSPTIDEIINHFQRNSRFLINHQTIKLTFSRYRQLYNIQSIYRQEIIWRSQSKCTWLKLIFQWSHAHFLLSINISIKPTFYYIYIRFEYTSTIQLTFNLSMEYFLYDLLIINISTFGYIQKVSHHNLNFNDHLHNFSFQSIAWLNWHFILFKLVFIIFKLSDYSSTFLRNNIFTIYLSSSDQYLIIFQG